MTELQPHPLDRCGEIARIPRSQLKESPYNPRTITDDERRRLKRSLQENGLIEPFVWNKRTGNIVGGHQRTKILDKLTDAEDWLAPVVIVDMTDAQEKQANVALNNKHAQGKDDQFKLQELFKTPDINIEAMGFDIGQVASMFPPLSQVIPSIQASVESHSQQWKQKRDERDARETAAVNRIIAGDELQGDKAEERVLYGDDDFYRIIVFRDFAQASAFSKRLGVPETEREIDGRIVVASLKD